MAISIAIAQAHLDQWLAADLAVSSGQEYTLDGRSFSRVDAEEIRNNIDYWNRAVEQATRIADGGGKISISVANLTK